MKLWVRQKYLLQVTKPLILKIIRSYANLTIYMNCKTKESLTFQNIKHLVTIIYFLDTPVTIYTLSL